MGMDTNDLDTRDEDKARTEGRIAEFWEDKKEDSEEAVGNKTYGESPVKTAMNDLRLLFTVEYFTNNKWHKYSGPHKNIDSAICNASVVSGCRKSNARIMMGGKVVEEGDAGYWEGKLKEKAGD